VNELAAPLTEKPETRYGCLGVPATQTFFLLFFPDILYLSDTLGQCILYVLNLKLNLITIFQLGFKVTNRKREDWTVTSFPKLEPKYRKKGGGKKKRVRLSQRMPQLPLPPRTPFEMPAKVGHTIALTPRPPCFSVVSDLIFPPSQPAGNFRRPTKSSNKFGTARLVNLHLPLQ
jgi:hypothetical protein